MLESFSFRTAIHESNKVRGQREWSHFVRSAKAPELPVILLEDFAALLGLVFALFGVGMTLLTKNPIFDVLGTGLIGVLLICVAVFLAVEMKSLLIGESATPEHQRAIAAAITASEGVNGIIHMKTLHLGPEEVLVGVKIAVPANASAELVSVAIDEAERNARNAAPDLRLVMYVEPDIERTTT